MGIDLSKMRAEACSIEQSRWRHQRLLLEARRGYTPIRLVCPEGGDPFFEAYYHYGMGAEGKTTVLSPRTIWRR